MNNELEPLNEQWEQFAFFGIKPVRYKSTTSDQFYWLVREVDIETLPIYDFWKESAFGSTCMPDEQHPGKSLVYVHDWEAFCKLFIKTGKHRFNAYS